jgi:hypothetical protein
MVVRPWWAAALLAVCRCASPGASGPTDAAADSFSPSGEAATGETAAPGDDARAPGTDGGDATYAEGGSTCSSVPLCDDFEQDAPGALPMGWTVVMGCNPNTVDGPAEGGGLILGVDSSQHHSGTNSLRVVGGDSCGYYAVKPSAFASLSDQLYARFWVMFSGAPTEGHNGFLSMSTAGGDHLRLGFQDRVIAWNAQKSDATLPDMDPQGTGLSVSTPAATWTCIELHLDPNNGHMEFWLNGSSSTVPGLSYDGGVVQGVNDQWARGAPLPLRPADLALGWLGLNDQQTVWFDDVALAGARIGCQ